MVREEGQEGTGSLWEGREEGVGRSPKWQEVKHCTVFPLKQAQTEGGGTRRVFILTRRYSICSLMDIILYLTVHFFAMFPYRLKPLP